MFAGEKGSELHKENSEDLKGLLSGVKGTQWSVVQPMHVRKPPKIREKKHFKRLEGTMPRVTRNSACAHQLERKTS